MFINPKIESFWLVCKLHYLYFGFQIYRSSRSQMFFKIDVLKHFPWSQKNTCPEISGNKNSLFIPHENIEWCHFVVCVGSSAIILFYCVYFFSFSFFYFLFVFILCKILFKVPLVENFRRK